MHTITCQKENTEVSGASSRLRLASFGCRLEADVLTWLVLLPFAINTNINMFTETPVKSPKFILRDPKSRLYVSFPTDRVQKVVHSAVLTVTSFLGQNHLIVIHALVNNDGVCTGHSQAVLSAVMSFYVLLSVQSCSAQHAESAAHISQ